jgi:hypothetical protein
LVNCGARVLPKTGGILMKHTNLRVIKPDKMNDKQKNELVSLHQKYITLSTENILDYLKNRDKLYLYYNRKNKQLIATAGVQFLVTGNKVFIYIGNTVVDKKFMHEGCLSHALMKSLIFSFFRYPFKKKYWCALTSSSGAFAYAQKYQPCWPNIKQKTPDKMTQLMEHCIKKMGVSEYKIIDGNVITYDLSYKVNETFHTAPKTKPCVNASFFSQINPGSTKGEQLFFVNEFRFYKLINVLIYSLHDRLINQPKLYHSLQKKRLENPFMSGFIIVNNLIPKWFKWLGGLAIGALVYLMIK